MVTFSIENVPMAGTARMGIRHVARLAGVSPTTISRVLNGAPGVRPETAARVRAVIQSVGFRVNAIGRSLVTGRTRVVGMLIPTLTNPVFSGSVTGFVREAEQAGFGVLLATSDYDARRETAAVEMFLSQRVAGMALILTAPSAAILSTVRRARVPLVLLYNHVPARSQVVSVCVDDYGLARELVTHMLQTGHRRIAMVTGVFASSDRARHRFNGYVAAMRAAGLAPMAPIEVDYLGTEFAGDLRPIMTRRDPPTALFCSNDLLAIAVIDAVRSLGFDVPEDVSVAGVDGIEMGRFVRPRLTTAALPTVDMGRTAWEVLAGFFEGRSASGPRVLPHRLELGGTIQPPGASAVRHERRDPVEVRTP
jgi:DNA-binding LacI/PurR family transcriptional regulator